MSKLMSPLNRRKAVQAGLAIAAAAAAPDPARSATAEPKRESIRVGFVGVGGQGWRHVVSLLHIEGVELVAVCDIREAACVKTQQRCRMLGMPEPVAYTRGETDFRRMCETEDLDLVFTATPWRWHVPVCLAAMTNGAHAATEVPAALTLDQCWQLVETSEATGRHLSMMENVNYRRDELMVLRMCREGVLGELIHGEAGYMNDTRDLKASDTGEGRWLGEHHANRNGNLYPTHGLGPMAWNFNLGRGNRMEYLVSMGSKARGMNAYAQEHLPQGHPHRKRQYINGDMNSSLIQLANGESLIIKHNTDLPRPYSRINLVHGTGGIVRGFPEFVVSLEEESVVDGSDSRRPGRPRYTWQKGDSYYEKYDHPLWTHISEKAARTPIAADGFVLADELHRGVYLEDYRLIQALLNYESPDFDVYDAASWSAVTPLSERSVANRSQPVDFPDFTRGQWKMRSPVKIMGV